MPPTIWNPPGFTRESLSGVGRRQRRRRNAAGAVKNVLLIADGALIHVDIVTQNGAITATTNRGSIKTWVTIDASARWIKGLGIGKAQLEIGRWLPGQRGMSL